MTILQWNTPGGADHDRESRKNNSKVTILDSIHKCNMELRRAKTDLLSRRFCSEFQSDYITIDGFNPVHVKGFADRFKLISAKHVLDEIVYDGHNSSNSSYDSQWQIGVNKNDKYFEAERFIYCRIHDDRQRNLKPTVIMMLVYLKAKKKHQDGIMRELKHTFSSIMTSSDETEVVDQSTVEMVKETNHHLTYACNSVVYSLGMVGMFLGFFLSLFKIYF